jgi:hypothetical protein
MGLNAGCSPTRSRVPKPGLYSLVQTARANELEPYAYLCRLFEQLPAATRVADFETLLPWNITRANCTRVRTIERLR